MMRISKQVVTISEMHHEKMMTSIRKGLHFVFSKQEVFGAMSLDFVAVLFGGATAMLPIFANEILHVVEKGFGLLRAAPFAGSGRGARGGAGRPPRGGAGGGGRGGVS